MTGERALREALADLGCTVHTTDKAALQAWLDSDECRAWVAADPLNRPPRSDRDGHAAPGPCLTCGAREDRCLSLILAGEDGTPGACCADCDHPQPHRNDRSPGGAS